MSDYSLRWVSADGTTLYLNSSNPANQSIRTRGRTGDWGALPFKVIRAGTPDGSRTLPVDVQYGDGLLVAQTLIQPVAGGSKMWDLQDAIADALGPLASDGRPNRGYLYFGRIDTDTITTADEWRLLCEPVGHDLQKPEGEDLDYYYADLRFRACESGWEAESAAVSLSTVINANAFSSPVDINVTPGGNMPCEPTWTVQGPSSGEITGIKLENLTTGKVLEFSGIPSGVLVNGQSATITTGFQAKDIQIAGTSYYRTRSQVSSFWPLLPSEQSVRVTIAKSVGAATVTVKLSYRKRRNGF